MNTTELAGKFEAVCGGCMSCPPSDDILVFPGYGSVRAVGSPTDHHYKRVSEILWDIGLSVEEFNAVWPEIVNSHADVREKGEICRWYSGTCFTPEELANAVALCMSRR